MPLTPFVDSDAKIKNRVARMCKVEVGDLPGWWDQIIADAHVAATNEIYSKLAGRGFSVAQISAWDRGEEFEIAIALYWAFVEGAALEGYDPTWIDKLDRRAELDEVDITTDGELVENEDPQIGFGYQSEEDSTFSIGLADEDTATQW